MWLLLPLSQGGKNRTGGEGTEKLKAVDGGYRLESASRTEPWSWPGIALTD